MGDPNAPASLEVVTAGDGDLEEIRQLLRRRWHAPYVVSRGRVHRAADLEALFANLDGERAGMVTFEVDGDALEVVSLDAYVPSRGVGTALLRRTVEIARARSLRRLWLVTANDNIDALGFYLHFGMRLVAVHLDSLEEARRLKPQIPRVGHHGLPVNDELELELALDGSS